MATSSKKHGVACVVTNALKFQAFKYAVNHAFFFVPDAIRVAFIRKEKQPPKTASKLDRVTCKSTKVGCRLKCG